MATPRRPQPARAQHDQLTAALGRLGHQVGFDIVSTARDRYGINRAGNFDTKAAATETGVKQRTIQKWAARARAGRGLPDSEPAKRFRDRLAETAGANELRRRTAAARAARNPQGRTGVRIRVRGTVTISSDTRARTIVEPNPGNLLDDWAAGDHNAMRNWVNDAYVPGMHLDELDAIDFEFDDLPDDDLAGGDELGE